MHPENLAGKVIVITGASSGFGKGAALKFARGGAHVVLVARRGHLLRELADACAQAGGRALAVPADVGNPDELRHVADAALREFGRIDVWINNAGAAALGPFERVPLDDHIQVIRTDLIGSLSGSWIAYRQFLAQGAGILINISSELGGHTLPYYASYAAAKHGVVGLGDSLRQEIELGGHGKIHVCTVMPAAHDTPFFSHAANYTGHEVQAPKPLHDPAQVIDTLVRLAQDPKDAELVGADGMVKVQMRKLAPGLEQRLVGRMMQRVVENAPPARDSAGALRRPRTGTR